MDNMVGPLGPINTEMTRKGAMLITNDLLTVCRHTMSKAKREMKVQITTTKLDLHYWPFQEHVTTVARRVTWRMIAHPQNKETRAEAEGLETVMVVAEEAVANASVSKANVMAVAKMVM